MSVWRLLGIFGVIAGLSGAVGYASSLLIVERALLPLPVGIIVCAAITAAAALLGFRGMVSRLVQIDLTLTYLNQNRDVAEIPRKPNELLSPILAQLNLLIHERARLKAMSGQLYEQISETAAQEERNRLARDLHDSIKQQVFSMSVSAAAAYAHLESNPVAAREALLDVKTSAQEAMVEMRALLQQLAPAPLEKSGLIDALREQAEAFAYRTGAKIETRFGELPDNRLFPIGSQEAVFRIAQEALSNIARHARAQNVTLSLEQVDGRINLHLSDDGQGFDVRSLQTGMGLSNIRSRAEAMNALVHLESAPGSGTTLEISMPLIRTEEVNGDPEMLRLQESHLNTYTRWIHFFAGSVCAAIVAFPLIVGRINNELPSLTEDPVLSVLLALITIVGVGGLISAVYSFIQAQRSRSQLLVSVGQESSLYYKMRRITYISIATIWLFALWFVPIAWAGNPVPAALTPVAAAVFTAFMLWNYFQNLRMCTRELLFIPPVERMATIRRFQAMVRQSWLSFGVLVFLLILSDTFRNGIQLVPESRDAWMTSIMLVLAFLLFANQIVYIVYYRYQYQQAEKEAAR